MKAYARDKETGSMSVMRNILVEQAKATAIPNTMLPNIWMRYSVSPKTPRTITVDATLSDVFDNGNTQNTDFLLGSALNDNTGKYTEVMLADIAAQLPEYTQLRNNGLILDITLPDGNNALIYNVTTKTCYVSNLKKQYKNDEIVLLQGRWNTGFLGGYLWEQYVNQRSFEDVIENNVPGLEGKVSEFTKMFYTAGRAETFFWFADPHYYDHDLRFTPGPLESCDRHMVRSLHQMASVYNQSPVSFCLCSGDWLTRDDTIDTACYKLGRSDGICRSLFKRYVPVLGDHEYNYTGAAMPQKALANLMFHVEGDTHYKYKATNSTFYVLDSKNVEKLAQEDERWAQLQWLAESLKTDDDLHNVIACHKIMEGDSVAEGYITPFGTELTKLLQAYNARGTSTIKGQSYNFAACKGTVHCALVGHMHEDFNTVYNGIPVIGETCVWLGRDHGPEAYDLCQMDFDAHVLHMVRIGYGANRDIQIIPTIA